MTLEVYVDEWPLAGLTDEHEIFSDKLIRSRFASIIVIALDYRTLTKREHLWCCITAMWTELNAPAGLGHDHLGW